MENKTSTYITNHSQRFTPPYPPLDLTSKEPPIFLDVWTAHWLTWCISRGRWGSRATKVPGLVLTGGISQNWLGTKLLSLLMSLDNIWGAGWWWQNRVETSCSTSCSPGSPSRWAARWLPGFPPAGLSPQSPWFAFGTLSGRFLKERS